MHDSDDVTQLRSEADALRRRVLELEARAAQSEQIEAALRQTEARFAALFRASPVAVVISTPEGRYLDVNERFCTITGYSAAEVLGHTSTELRIWVDTTQRAEVGTALVASGVIRDIELDFRAKTGDVRTMLASLALIELDGQPCVLTMCHDITDRRQAALERERLLGETQAALRVRDDFLSIAAHELRTPLTALQLYLESMQRGVARQPELQLAARPLLARLDQAVGQTERLARLINALLDVTRIRAGQLEIEWAVVDLAAVARDTVAQLASTAARSSSEIELCVDAEALVNGDRARLEQVVTNLLTNAIKYGEGQPITVSVTRDAQLVRLIVQDAGIGIAPEHQRRIFERFGRAVSGSHFGGLGLGLYIVRQIVTALGGSLSVESQLGQGARFCVTLPAHARPRGNAAEEDA